MAGCYRLLTLATFLPRNSDSAKPLEKIAIGLEFRVSDLNFSDCVSDF